MRIEIKVLGPGCPNCKTMEELARKAVQELGIEANIEKVTDMIEIMKYTMTTPGLIVNGKLKHKGKPLPTIDKTKELIKEEL
ncbi:MAG: thioredoxin family protein [Thermodesulfovibrionales bacterium]|nr:thioredoxin family protein [Thermodesulfovibrionales bacterium]